MQDSYYSLSEQTRYPRMTIFGRQLYFKGLMNGTHPLSPL